MNEPASAPDAETAARWARLLDVLRKLPGAVVAFSGGVDSSLLLLAAREALGDRVLAVTARSATFTPLEEESARELAARLGARWEVLETDVLSDPAFRSNPPDRCYVCKLGLLTKLRTLAAQAGDAAVLEGSNADDLGDDRPGRRAVEELDVRSPLREVGLTKTQIRALARAHGLPNWDRPAAACLATRVAYGEELTVERLRRIASAEQALRARGFVVVRVRDHGATARIEVGADELPRLLGREMRVDVVAELKSAGYTWVAVDLEGYRTGGMNEGPGAGGRGPGKE
ncbi:MAG: ATP-dependent sacrificial sulfur transferase LarE [Deltaproteobacteria bacterium]|nr:ATP-dependent sacrificial sulfur transferase LarE [Deltaproteobacteria bacterium]